MGLCIASMYHASDKCSSVLKNKLVSLTEKEWTSNINKNTDGSNIYIRVLYYIYVNIRKAIPVTGHGGP
jgi:hypothetical protein